ncbi:MAG: hypothetical protein J6M53_09175 [Bacteroidaceae bacterium]|nr:hypothetical protein [Bacteroidaceae bacterium]
MNARTYEPMPPQQPRTSGCLNGCLATGGFVCVAVALLMIVYGVVYGYTEDKAFYQRQDDWHALDDQREALTAELDSLRLLLADAEPVVDEEADETEAVSAPQGDTLRARELRAQIDSIESSDLYEDLYGIPEPPRGFSGAYIVTIIVCVLALLPLGAGIALLVAWGVRRKHRPTENF